MASERECFHGLPDVSTHRRRVATLRISYALIRRNIVRFSRQTVQLAEAAVAYVFAWELRWFHEKVIGSIRVVFKFVIAFEMIIAKRSVSQLFRTATQRVSLQRFLHQDVYT